MTSVGAKCAVLAMTISLGLAASAKRMNPKPVAPIVQNGIQYSVDGDGKDGFIVATNLVTKKVLWKKKVFHKLIKFWMEEDVQWIFINSLALKDERLLLSDEAGRCYALDLSGKNLQSVSCLLLSRDER